MSAFVVDPTRSGRIIVDKNEPGKVVVICNTGPQGPAGAAVGVVGTGFLHYTAGIVDGAIPVDPTVAGHMTVGGAGTVFVSNGTTGSWTTLSFGGGDGKTVKAMADADQTLSTDEANKSLFEATGALTQARALNVATIAVPASSFRRSVFHAGTDGVLLAGTVGGSQQVALRPGHRAIVEFNDRGAVVVADKPLDPRDFGCVWDGVTDDAPAFQAMLDSLPAGNLFFVTIKCPAGRAWMASEIHIRRPVILIGEGAGVWNQKGTTTNTPHHSLYGSVIRFAPGLAGFIVHDTGTSGDGGSGRAFRAFGVDVQGTRTIISTGSGGGRNTCHLDPTYDTRQNNAAYEKGRLLLRSGTSTTGSGDYFEGATRGGTRVAFRVIVAGTTASSAPAAYASATTANINDEFTDGTCAIRVVSIPKDYEYSRDYVAGEQCRVPGVNWVILECVEPGTSRAFSSLSMASIGVGADVAAEAAVGIHGQEFYDVGSSGLKWRIYTQAAFLILTSDTRIDHCQMMGFDAGRIVSSEYGAAADHTIADMNHVSHCQFYYNGIGDLYRGSDAQGGTSIGNNYEFQGHGNTDVDGGSYLDLGNAPTGGKWGNGGFSILDRSIGGNEHIGHYSQFSDAPAWCNHNTDGGGFNAEFIGCRAETDFNSMIRGNGSLINCQPLVVSPPIAAAEPGGFVLDPQKQWGKGIREIDYVSLAGKKMQGGICQQTGTGGMHWVQSVIDEYGPCAFGWNYESSCVDSGATVGKYNWAYAPVQPRIAFWVGGAKATEGLCMVGFPRGYFVGNDSNSIYRGPIEEIESNFVRGGYREIGDEFHDASVTSGYAITRCIAVGYEGRAWSNFADQTAYPCESYTTPYYIASVALPGDQIKAGNQVWRVTAKTGDGLHGSSEPTWAGSPSPGDTIVEDHGTGTVTYTYVGATPSYANAGYVGTLPSSGEVNTASNYGGGIGIFRDKDVYDLRFKTLVEGANVTIDDDGDTLTINAAGAGGITGADTLLVYMNGANNPDVDANLSFDDGANKELTVGGNVRSGFYEAYPEAGGVSTSAASGIYRAPNNETALCALDVSGTGDLPLCSTGSGNELIYGSLASNAGDFIARTYSTQEHIFQDEGQTRLKMTADEINSGLPRLGLGSPFGSEGLGEIDGGTSEIAASEYECFALAVQSGGTGTYTFPPPGSYRESYFKLVLGASGEDVFLTTGVGATATVPSSNTWHLYAFTPIGVFLAL